MNDVLWHPAVFPAALALAGFALMLNIKGAADRVHFTIERVMNDLVGGITPRTVRVFGTAMFAFGTVGAVIAGGQALDVQ